jgi:bifunctional DNA-binding transcriptional regulator/antitoxin component of YhaV-PrlF toxin-antitoxin module
MNTYTLEVKQSDDGELYLDLPDEVLTELGWKIGDTLLWEDNKDGSFSLKKKETQWVLVETVSTFRHRYAVEVPTGEIEWASDTVVCNEAKELSQKHLDETIVSSRYISYEDALKIAREDNSYIRSFTEEQVVSSFLTKMEDYKP